MGKSSSSSCWKIIACGSDSAAEDDIESEEARGSTDKCGWRFRKRPARHRVLRNSAITVNCTSPGNSAVSEKVMYFEQQDEKPQPEQQDEKPQPPHMDPKLPTSLELKMLETVEDPKSSASVKRESDETVDAQPELPISMEAKVSGTVVELSPEPPASVEPEVHETMVASTTESQPSAEPLISETLDASQEVDYSAIVEEPSVVIQSGVRGFLAQSELSKLKSIIKLQAAIRGHLVRRHAVDALHCFQGIVKFQSIVRGHQSNLLGGEVSANKPVKIQTSMEKLLSNAFAHQLLESIPKSKSTTIKSDPMKPSLAWNWLERWMAASSSELPELQKPEISAEEAPKPTEEDSSQPEVGNMSKVISKSLNSGISFNDAPSSFLRSESSFKDAASSFLRSESSFKDDPSSFLRSESSFKDAPSSFLRSEPSFKDAPSSILYSGSSFKDAPSLLKSDSSFKDAPSLFENEKNSSSNAGTVDNRKLLDFSLTREKMEYPSHSHDRTNQSFMEPLENVAMEEDQSNQSDSASPTESCSHFHSHKTSSRNEVPKICAKSSASASEQIDADGKRFAYGSIKAINPSFIAAQSKIEELSSAVNSGRSLSSPRVDNDIDSRVDADTVSSSVMGSAPEGKDPGAVEIPQPDDLRVQIGGSESGTKLSVTSTLDSPDRSEAGIGEADLELKFMGGQAGDAISKEQSFEFETNDNYGPNNTSDLSSCFSVQQKVDVCETNGESAKPVIAIDSALQIEEPKKVAPVEHANDKYVYSITSCDSSPPQVEEPETNSSDKNQIETSGSGMEHSAHQDNLPPIASSNSQTTDVESQETPSSQVSVKAKRSKIDKSGSHSHPRQSSVSSGKRSPCNATHDSSARSSSADILAKDQKSGGKRKNSFGSAKLDNNVDQEPRDSTSSIRTLPSYMQATESARAKAHSPRLSPDVQENKDAYAKKRHSLPGATGRQGSPRVQQSSSQAPQQPTKANGNTPTSQERRWVR